MILLNLVINNFLLLMITYKALNNCIYKKERKKSCISDNKVKVYFRFR